MERYLKNRSKKFDDAKTFSNDVDYRFTKIIDDVEKKLESEYKTSFTEKEKIAWQKKHELETNKILDQWRDESSKYDKIMQDEATKVFKDEGFDGIYIEKDV